MMDLYINKKAKKFAKNKNIRINNEEKDDLKIFNEIKNILSGSDEIVGKVNKKEIKRIIRNF